VDAEIPQPTDEATHLTALNDLLGIATVPGTSSGGEPSPSVRALIDLPIGTLRSDFAYEVHGRIHGRHQ
jgi:hypothetical protein